MDEIWKPGVIFMRHIGSDGKSYIEQHQCWNTDGFVQKQHDAAMAVRTNSKAKDDKTAVEVVTQDDYRRERWAKK